MKTLHYMDTLTNETDKYFEKICTSASFVYSEHSVRILSYLNEKRKRKEHVGKSIIASELFDPTNDSDGKFRWHMYTLRKKLDDYYSEEGADDEEVFVLDKDQYNLKLREKKDGGRKQRVTRTIFQYAVLLLIFTLSTLFCWEHFQSPNNYVWAKFLDPNASTLCCIGDYFILEAETFYDSKDNTEGGWDFHYTSNQEEIDRLERADVRFVTPMGPIGAAKLSNWIGRHHHDIDVLMESDLALEDLIQNNIVYVGPYVNEKNMGDLFLQNSSTFHIKDNQLCHKKTGQAYIQTNQGNYRSGYAVVSYQPLSNNGNAILFFASNNDLGVQSVVERFTNIDFLQKFYTQLPSSDSYFTAIFCIKEESKTCVGCELVELEVNES